MTKGSGDLGKWSLREQSSAENVRLPRETEVNVTERCACHAKCRGAPGKQGDQGAPLNPAQCCKCNACDAKRRPMPPSATPAVQTETMSPPATQNEGRCHQAPRLPGETEVNVTDPRAPPACHEKNGRCHQVPRLPRKVPRPPATRKGSQCHPVPRLPSAVNATSATQKESRCHQAPRPPCKTKVNIITECHAYQPSAAGATHACQAKRRSRCVTKLYVKELQVKDCVCA